MSGRATDPKDWLDWEKYRDQVIHPAATIKPTDIERAGENIRRHAWAHRFADRLRESADGIVRQVSPEYLENTIEPTTPGCVGPCPACRARGLPWHPNGQWAWSPSDPDRLRCAVCDTVFPNAEFPEDIVIECTWGKGQRFTFVGGETFRCFAYHDARPSLSGITRARKVGHVTGQLQDLAIAHVLTGDARYARAAKAILLRFAEVFPEYLVRAGYGYGEYAGMDPHVAAERILDLPEDELVYPPNRPDRKVFAGYWAASRIGTSGMDGGWVVRVADAYSLTCTAQEGGAPVYGRDERTRIERDVLLESTYLAACDPAINNKSVGNRAGAAVAGMCVGHPGLVHFGLDGFVRAVDGWFLPDGGTSESPAYAMMTMNGIRPFALAFRGYSDPPGYAGPDRLDGFDACRDTLYGDCWQALVWTLQGDLHFTPSADSYRSTAIGLPFADLLALAYPTDAHVALLKELIARDGSGGSHQSAVFYRDPDLASRPAPPFELPDVVFPYLSQGYLRTGEDGREGVAALNAADHGVHHHLDGLNLYYWKDGHELLSDLGYLWDHPDKYQTARTSAHNLVMIDGKDQTGRGRRGAFHLFSVTPAVKVMEASSDGYGPGSVYRRTCLQIDRGQAGSYLLDIFRASGGQRADYLFHGPHSNYRVVGLDLRAGAAGGYDSGEAGPALTGVLRGSGQGPWSVVWTFEDGYTFEAFAPGCAEESVFVGSGWGQRDHRNTDVGATLPYVVRRLEGAKRNTVFAAAFVGSRGPQTLVEAIRVLPLPAGAPEDAVAVAVRTAHGVDIVISTLNPVAITVPTDIGEVSTDGRLAAVLTEGGRPSSACLIGGTGLSAPGLDLTAPKAVLSGRIHSGGSGGGHSYFDIDGDRSEVQGLRGQTLFAIGDDARHGYLIRGVEPAGAGCRVFTRRDNRGFEARPAKAWELPVTVFKGIARGDR